MPCVVHNADNPESAQYTRISASKYIRNERFPGVKGGRGGKMVGAAGHLAKLAGVSMGSPAQVTIGVPRLQEEHQQN